MVMHDLIYLGDAGLDMNQGRLVNVVGFLSPSRQISSYNLEVGHGHFLPNPVQITLPTSQYHGSYSITK
jgi:hypothetical protein